MGIRARAVLSAAHPNINFDLEIGILCAFYGKINRLMIHFILYWKGTSVKSSWILLKRALYAYGIRAFFFCVMNESDNVWVSNQQMKEEAYLSNRWTEF